MKIQLTFGEALEKYDWLKICDVMGFNEWGINEGLMDKEDTFTMTEDEAIRAGVLPKKEVG